MQKQALAQDFEIILGNGNQINLINKSDGLGPTGLDCYHQRPI